MTKNELEMMKRTDEPSVKMKLQVTIKNILSQNPTAEQFISQLEAQGINVLFNQASTGFVSGISYGCDGMRFKGAHLGNAYKWQAVKNAINYEQERDRTTINQAMLGQAPTSLNEPDNQPQPEQPSELSQIQKLLPEIEKMYSRALENYRIKSERQIETTARRLNQLESTAANLSFQIKSIVASAEQIYQSNNQVGSRWVIRLYLVAILSGICSALITMLIVWIRLR